MIRQKPEILDMGSSGVFKVKVDNRSWSTAKRFNYSVQQYDPQAFVLQSTQNQKFVSLIKSAKSSFSIRILQSSAKPKSAGWRSPSILGMVDFGTFPKKNFTTVWKKFSSNNACKFSK
jgi:hypothetical protein